MSAMGKIGSRTAEAGRSVAGWVEDRTGVLSWLARFLNHPAPKRGAWMYALGTTALFLMTLQFLTGILLLFYYAPTTDHAWNSIYYIMNEAYFGQLIRGIHYWSANVLLAIIGLHMVQVFLSGAYKAPREVNWVLGVTLLLLTLGIAFTGYVLRWDQDGFWATVVGIKIGSYSPFVGSSVTHFLLGGDALALLRAPRLGPPGTHSAARAVARRRPRTQAQGVRQRDGVPRQDRESAGTQASPGIRALRG